LSSKTNALKNTKNISHEIKTDPVCSHAQI
jgi:hypothetical protein